LAGDVVDENEILNALHSGLNVNLQLVQLSIEDLASQNPLFGKLIEMFAQTEFPIIDINTLRELHPQLHSFSSWLEEFGKSKLSK